MLIPNQYIELTWVPSIIKYYTNKGYNYTKQLDTFLVKAEDLHPKSNKKVKFTCDNCGKPNERIFVRYLESSNIYKVDLCQSCCYNIKDNKIKDSLTDIDDKVSLYFQLLNGKIEKLPNRYWNSIDENDISSIIKYIIDDAIKNKLINSLEEVPKMNSDKVFRKYKVATLKKYYTTQELINIAYPNKWKPWEFNRVPEGYWGTDDNIKNAIEWFLNKLFEQKHISKIDDILNLDQAVFKLYGFDGLFYKKFNSSPTDFWEFLFPNRWYKWQFKSTGKNFWCNKENRIIALKQLIDLLKININEVPSTLTYSFLVNHYHKFSITCDYFYNSNLFKWIDECFPDKFNEQEFGLIIATDGTKLDSNEECIIHNYLISEFSNVKYYDNNIREENKWFNEKTNEKYVADWLLNSNVIVEYFGWYNTYSYNKNDIITNYIDKTHRKIEFFSNLDNFDFIALFPHDLRNNLEGVRNKFNALNLKTK